MTTRPTTQTALHRLLQLSNDDPRVAAALTWIEAPESALALPLVLDGVTDLLDAFQTVAAANAPALDAVVAPLAQVTEGVRRVQSLLAAHSNLPSRRPDKSRLLPFRGVMSSHPIYTLLGSWHWRLEAARRDAIAREAIATVVLFAKARAHALAGSAAGLTPIYDACTKMRELLHDHPEVLRERRQARDWTRAAPSSELEPACDAVRRIIQPVLKDHDLLEESPPEEEEAQGETIIAVHSDAQGDRHDNLRSQTVIRLHSTTKRALERSGLFLAEFQPQEEYVEWTESGEDDPLDPTLPAPVERSLAEQVLRTRAMIGRRERAMQLLAADWTRATEAEIARLWQAIVRWSTDAEHHKRDAAALLALALWTSHPTRRDPDGGLVRLKVVTHGAQAPQGTATHPLLLLDRKMLRLPVLRPSAEPQYRHARLDLARSCTDTIDMPLPAALTPILDRMPAVCALRNSPRNSPRSRPVNAFPDPAVDVLANSTGLLREHVAQTGGRLTLSAVESWMFRRLVERRRDHALASLATGRPHVLADTGLHYLHMDAAALLRCVAEEQALAWADLVHADASLERAAAISPGLPPDSESEQAGIGSPIVPRDEAVRMLADRLAQQLDQARLQPLADDALLTLHNALTHYVHAMLRFSLGLRDVGQPLPSWDRIDLHHGVVLLSDKDDVAASATRLVPLCPTAAKQLQIYAQHARAMLTRFVPAELASPPPVLFYLRRGRSERMERIDRPTRDMVTTIETASGYTLPRNTGRHWLRSRLAQMGLRGELIEFFMGHWQRGAEPWGRFSSLPAQAAIDALREPIEQLVREAGFRAVRGWV
ncbi:MAG: DNA breaking-rejoining enzyme, catalytic core [Thiomonas sp.]